MRLARPMRIAACTIETELGWIAIAGRERTLLQLTFGHATPAEALSALAPEWRDVAAMRSWHAALERGLRRFAAGERVEFDDIEIDLADLTPFARRVVSCCRKIPYGERLSYGELALRAGAPRAARAVGNVMASNRTPLVVPCHRVVASGERIGGYSGAAGVRTKLRLLETESRSVGAQLARGTRLPSRRVAVVGSA